MDKRVYIRKVIVYFLFIILISSFQVSFTEFISFHGQLADLMFVFVALVSYMFGFRDGAVVAVFSGLIRDYFAAPIIVGIDGSIVKSFGIGVLVLFVTGAISSSFFTHRLHRNWAFAFVSVVFCTVVYKVFGHLIIGGWLSIIGDSYSIDYSIAIVDSLLPQMLLNLIAAVPIYVLLRFVGPYRRGVNPTLIDQKEVTILG